METGVEGQSLTAEDQLYILTKAAIYLIATRGLAAPDARICYERAEALCHSLNRPQGPARLTALAKPCSLLGRDSGFIGSRVEETEARINLVSVLPTPSSE